MPEKKPASRRVSRVPWGVIGAVGLILLGESWVKRHELAVTNRGVAAYAYSGGAVSMAVGAEVISFGDSLIKFAIAPRAVERRSGKSFYNLAVQSAVAPQSYYLLKRCLDRGARPAAIVVGFKPTQLQVDPRLHTEQFSSVLTVRECIDLATTARDPDLFARLMAARFLSSLRARLALREIVAASFQGRSFSYAEANLTSFRNWNVNRGGGLQCKNPAVESPAPYWDELIYDRLGVWRCDPLSAVYVRRFLNLAASHEIPVFWVAAPINPRVQAKRDRLRLDDAYTRMMRRAVAQYPNLTVIDGRHSDYPTRVFVDGSHLDLEGAFAFSDDLGDVLRRREGSRWVEMPAYRPRRVPPDLEDESLSRFALFGGPRPGPPTFAVVPGPLRR